MPTLWAARTKPFEMGLWATWSVTFSGPPVPWYSSARRSLFSDLRKYGRTPSYPQPVVAEVPPLVVVEPIAPDVDHRVDRRAAPEGAALRVVHPPAVQLRLGNRLEPPVDARSGQFREPGGHVDQRVPVAATGLEQEDPLVRVLAEPGRDGAAGGAGADDDVGVALSHRMPPERSDKSVRRRGEEASQGEGSVEGRLLADTQRLRRDGESGVLRRRGRKERRIHDEEIRDVMASAQRIQDRRRGVVAEPRRSRIGGPWRPGRSDGSGSSGSRPAASPSPSSEGGACAAPRCSRRKFTITRPDESSETRLSGSGRSSVIRYQSTLRSASSDEDPLRRPRDRCLQHLGLQLAQELGVAHARRGHSTRRNTSR